MVLAIQWRPTDEYMKTRKKEDGGFVTRNSVVSWKRGGMRREISRALGDR